MLYGYREALDNRTATIVAAADSVDEYDGWASKLVEQRPFEHLVEFNASILTDHLFRDSLKGYKRSVLLVYHVDESQRDAFIDKWKIVIVKGQAARDRQKDMLWLKQREEAVLAEADEERIAKGEGREVTGRTIEEINGLTEHDPWDRRTDAMKAQDEELRKQMKNLQKKGEISGDDSFGSAAEQRKARAESRGEAVPTDQGIVQVTDIRAKEDGGIDSILARKFGGEIDTNVIKPEQVKKRRVFTPDDFAAVLAGDGSADHLNIPADITADKQRREPGTKDLKLSKVAEEARAEHQEQQRIAAEVEKLRQREEENITGKAEHEKGIFRGSDLSPDQMINASELPQTIQDLLAKAKITADKFPLKDYPYNSQLGDKIILPSDDGRSSEYPVRLTTVDNLDILGTVSIGDAAANIATKSDQTKPGWAIYSQKRLAKEGDTEISYDINVVRVR